MQSTLTKNGKARRSGMVIFLVMQTSMECAGRAKRRRRFGCPTDFSLSSFRFRSGLPPAQSGSSPTLNQYSTAHRTEGSADQVPRSGYDLQPRVAAAATLGVEFQPAQPRWGCVLFRTPEPNVAAERQQRGPRAGSPRGVLAFGWRA